MSHVPVETVEEDAADLQFPKGTNTNRNICRIFYCFLTIFHMVNLHRINFKTDTPKKLAFFLSQYSLNHQLRLMMNKIIVIFVRSA